VSELAPEGPLVLEAERRLATLEGPRRLAHGRLGGEPATAIALGARRAAEEVSAIESLPSHPNAPAWARTIDEWLVVPRVTVADGDALESSADWLDAGSSGAVLEARRAPIESLLRALAPRVDRGGAVDVLRALRHLELPRGPLDRWLASEASVALLRGPDLGGVDPRLRGRDARGRLVGLSLRRARMDGVPELDRAAEELCARRVRAPDPDASIELGRDLARIDVAVRELVRARPGEHRDRLEALVRSRVLARLRTLPPRRRAEPFRAFEPARVRRERLFSRWAEGIRHDEEGLFSATPEALASRIAAGLSGHVLDGTCGIGSIAIALARTPAIDAVTAVDVSPDRVAMARHNARLYGVETRIRFRVADVHAVLAAERFDALVLDPPWGGRDYDRARTTLADLGLDVRRVLAACEGEVRLKLPKSFAREELPGFVFEELVDERGVSKMLLATRG
jgi:16S rRNA G966 N2-methylase RsmD